jgi:hypothetical protein
MALKQSFKKALFLFSQLFPDPLRVFPKPPFADTYFLTRLFFIKIKKPPAVSGWLNICALTCLRSDQLAFLGGVATTVLPTCLFGLVAEAVVITRAPCAFCNSFFAAISFAGAVVFDLTGVVVFDASTGSVACAAAKPTHPNIIKLASSNFFIVYFFV